MENASIACARELPAVAAARGPIAPTSAVGAAHMSARGTFFAPASSMRLLLFAPFAAAALGCTATIGTPGALVNDGALTLNFTINGVDDPNLCVQSAVDHVEVQVYDAADAFVGAFDAPCEAFGTTFTLPPGTYSGAARLLDASGAPRTTVYPIAPWDIISGTTLVITIDFPAAAFAFGPA